MADASRAALCWGPDCARFSGIGCACEVVVADPAVPVDPQRRMESCRISNSTVTSAAPTAESSSNGFVDPTVCGQRTSMRGSAPSTPMPPATDHGGSGQMAMPTAAGDGSGTRTGISSSHLNPDSGAVPVDRTPLDLDAEISAAIHRIEDRLPTAPTTHVFSTAEAIVAPLVAEAIVAPLVAELVQARADLASERQEAFMAKVWFERYRASAEVVQVEREMRAQVEVDARRLAAQVERVEALRNRRQWLGQGLVSIPDLDAALAVPAAEETTP